MKEFIEKLKARLEKDNRIGRKSFEAIIENINELAEEYKDKTNIIDGLKAFLKDKFDYCAEQTEMNLEAECNSEIASYFRNRKELYLDRTNIYGEVMREIDRLAEEYKGGCCEWEKHRDYWESKCDYHIEENWFPEIFSVAPDEYHCPYCGKKIKVV